VIFSVFFGVVFVCFFLNVTVSRENDEKNWRPKKTNTEKKGDVGVTFMLCVFCQIPLYLVVQCFRACHEKKTEKKKKKS